MSGYPDHNIPEFNFAAHDLRERGHYVLNPAETAGGEGRIPRPQLLSIDIAYIQASEALAMLSGWTLSQGANLELAVAHQLGKRAFWYDPTYDSGLGKEIYWLGTTASFTTDPDDPRRIRFSKGGHIESPRTPWSE